LWQEKDVETVGKLQPDTQLRQIHITTVMTAQRGVESLRTNTVMSCMRVCRKQALSRVKYYYY